MRISLASGTGIDRKMLVQNAPLPPALQEGPADRPGRKVRSLRQALCGGLGMSQPAGHDDVSEAKSQPNGPSLVVLLENPPGNLR